MDSLSLVEIAIAFSADDVWQAPDQFQRKSLDLWIQMNRIKKSKMRPHHCTVRTVIPTSRLAQYIDSSYDAEREAAYMPDSAVNELDTTDTSEPWMLPEVEQVYRRVRGARSAKVVHSVAVAQWIQEQFPGLAKNCQPFSGGMVYILGYDEVYELPNQLLELKDLKEIELQMRIKSTKKLWEANIVPDLVSSNPPTLKSVPCKSANCILLTQNCRNNRNVVCRSNPCLPYSQKCPSEFGHEYLDSSHLIRSLSSEATLMTDEWVTSHVFREMQGISEFTSMLRKTRSIQEALDVETTNATTLSFSPHPCHPWTIHYVPEDGQYRPFQHPCPTFHTFNPQPSFSLFTESPKERLYTDVLK